MKYLLTVLMLSAFGILTSAHADTTVYGQVHNEIELDEQMAQAKNNPGNNYWIGVHPKLDGSPYKITATYDVDSYVVLKGLGVKTETTGRNIVFNPDGGFSGPLFKVMTGARLVAYGLQPEYFESSTDGGTVDVQEGGSFLGYGLKFRYSKSLGNGGSVNCGPNSYCYFRDTRFFYSEAQFNGGAIAVKNGAQLHLLNSKLRGGTAGVFGCYIDNAGGNVTIEGSILSEKVDLDRCKNVGIENPFGRLRIYNTFLETDPTNDALDSTDDTGFQGSLFLRFQASFQNTTQQQGSAGGSLEGQCNDFGSGKIASHGFNVDSDGSCFLNQASDLPNTDPMVSIDSKGTPQPLAGSPLIESGPVLFVNNELPCAYKDINGLGRPQDFDLDGVFTCDRGPVEVQGGPDIGAPQSAAFYDSGRNGEGVFVEILENDLAIVSFYTYSPDGQNLVWFVGSGTVKGNSVVVDELQKVTGGVFGAGFDADKIVRTRVGGMSLVFPDCNATGKPGRINFTAEPDSGFENLLQNATRLTTIFKCDGSPAAANTQKGGAFYDAGRSGEGIFVEWLDDGRVVFVLYTFDSQGNAFWIINDVQNTVVNGSTVTAPMVYAMGKTRFGSNYNAGDVDLVSWGNVTLTYSDDNNLTFSYDSTVGGFGAGSLNYTRLTKLLGPD